MQYRAFYLNDHPLTNLQQVLLCRPSPKENRRTWPSPSVLPQQTTQKMPLEWKAMRTPQFLMDQWLVSILIPELLPKETYSILTRFLFNRTFSFTCPYPNWEGITILMYTFSCPASFFFFTKHLVRTHIRRHSQVAKYTYNRLGTATIHRAASDSNNSHSESNDLVDDHGNTIVDSAASDGDNSCLETNVSVDSRGNAIMDNATNDDDNIHLETEDPLDGRGDPNLSGITPPLPMNLIEPMCNGHETGYHVITAGTAIGISVIRYVFHTS